MEPKAPAAVAACLLLGVACTTYRANYDIGLVKVVATDVTGKTLPPGTITVDATHGSEYQDALIETGWTFGDYDLYLRLKNRAAEPIAVLWDKCVYADEKGAAHGIIHNGTDFREIGKPQAPVTIAPNTTERRQLKPAGYVKPDGSSWRTLPLFPCCGRSMEKLRTEAERYVGKSFSVVIVIQRDDALVNYLFDFAIRGVAEIQPVSTHF